MHTPCPQPECTSPAFAVTSVNVPSRLFLNRCEVRLLPLRKALQPRAVHQENIQPAVVVVVVKRHAATGRLQQIFILVLAAKNGFGVQPSLLSQYQGRSRRAKPHRRRRRVFACANSPQRPRTQAAALPADSRATPRTPTGSRTEEIFAADKTIAPLPFPLLRQKACYTLPVSLGFSARWQPRNKIDSALALCK